MKKRLSVILAVLVFLLALTGCSAVSTIRKLDAAEDMVEAKLDTVEEQLEDALRGTQAAAPAADITKEQALQIALDHLGFTEDQVTGARIEQEIDDGVPQFDISFFREDWEYEFEIDARQGIILSFEKDNRYD
jgi:uncharacterized membrane protein YkoI